MSTRLKKHTTHNAKPYDRPKNFFQKVASTLHDMFIPSWLLYDSSCKSDSNVTQAPVIQNLEDNVDSQRNLFQINHQRTSDGSDSSNNLCIRNESTKNIYMPEKRPTYSSYSIENEKRKREKSHLSDLTDNYNEITQTKTSNLLKNDTVRNNIKLQKKPIHQSFLNGDDHSDNSEGSASTSGCSSLVSSHQERKDQSHDYGLQISEEALEHIKKELSKKEEFKSKSEKKHISVETDSLSHGTDSNFNHNEIHSWYEEKIVCPNKRARPQPTFTGRKPSFNLSSFGAPSLGESSHSGENCCHSPFYEGKTAFGGASAINRSHILSSIPYPNMNFSNTKLKVKDVSSKKDFDYMSTTAKRILLSLEKMSTPLVDAKKIPTEKKTSVELCLRQKINSSISASTTNGSKYQMSSCKPPTTGLIMPSSSMIGKNLDGRISSDKTSNKIPFSISKISDAKITPLSSLSVKTTGKIRTRMSTTLHCSKKSNINEVVEIPDLPNIPLPIDKLPTFNFKTLSEKRESTQPKQSNGIQFKFSSPIQHNAPPTPEISSSEMCFTFSSPVSKETDASNNSPQNENLKQENNSFNEKKSENHEEMIPSAQKDNDKPTEQKQLQPLGFDERFKPAVGSWECSTCLVRNSESAVKCIACELPKSNVSTSEMPGLSDVKMESNIIPKTLDVSSNQEEKNESKISFSVSSNKVTNSSWKDFGDKFKPPPGSWSCPTCLISNNEIALRCVACETPNPHHKSPAVEQTPIASFEAKFKPPPGSWECDTCFVQNNSDALKCIACETSRCVSSKTKDSSQMFSGFKFGNTEKQNSTFLLENSSFSNNNNTGFKFGITPSGLSTTSESQEFTFGNKVVESRPVEGFKLNTSNFVAPTSAFTFGGKSLQINNECNNLTNGKTQFGINHNMENSKTVSFGSKVLPLSFEPNKSTPQLFGNQSIASKDETTNYILSKSPVSSSVTLTTTSTAPIVTVTPITTISLSSTTTTTVSTLLNFGKPQQNVLATTTVSPKNNIENTNILINPSSSCSFSFTNPQKITDISNRDNAVPDKVETNNENNENVTTTVSQKSITSFSFGSGTTTTTSSVFKAVTPNNIFTFGAPVPFSIVSTQQNVINSPKNLFTPNTTSQVSFANFGNKLTTTTFSQDSNQTKQGFGFQPLSDVQFNTPKSVPSNNVFRFGTLQDQKPADNAKPGFTFGASQDQKPSSGEQVQKQSFSFNFRTPQNEQKPPLSQDSCFNFNTAKGNDQEKPKFNFTFTPSQNIFGTPSTSAPTPNFNFAGNVASSGSPFPFTASPSGTSQPVRKYKRAVRRSAQGPGRRDN